MSVRDEIWGDMLEAGEVAPGATERYWTHVENRWDAEAKRAELDYRHRYAVICYGPRDRLEYLYRTPEGDGEGQGEAEMRAFMKAYGPECQP